MGAERLEGRTLNTGHRLERSIGEGTFGTVYAARTRENQRVAVKVLNPGTSSELSEPQIHASLDHANIIPFHMDGIEIFNGEKHSFIVMGYADRGSIADLRKKHGGVLPLTQVVDLTEQTTKGLQAVHDTGIVHRDVKDQNLFLVTRETGLTVAVGDFGLADRFIGSSFGQSTKSLGTPQYTAPEQITGDAQPASDQYSLAIATFRSVTGVFPLQGGTKEEFRQSHLSSNPLTFSEVLKAGATAIHDELNEVVQKALSKEPDTRYASIEEFGQAVREGYERGLAYLRKNPRSKSINRRAAQVGSAGRDIGKKEVKKRN